MTNNIIIKIMIMTAMGAAGLLTWYYQPRLDRHSRLVSYLLLVFFDLAGTAILGWWQGF